MDEQQKYIERVRKSYRGFCDLRREAREHLWNARQALKDPTLSPEQRDSWEETAFQNAQLIEELDENIADTERTLEEMEAEAKAIDSPSNAEVAKPGSGGATEIAIGFFIALFLILILLRVLC